MILEFFKGWSSKNWNFWSHCAAVSADLREAWNPEILGPPACAQTRFFWKEASEGLKLDPPHFLGDVGKIVTSAANLAGNAVALLLAERPCDCVAAFDAVDSLDAHFPHVVDAGVVRRSVAKSHWLALENSLFVHRAAIAVHCYGANGEQESTSEFSKHIY